MNEPKQHNLDYLRKVKQEEVLKKSLETYTKEVNCYNCGENVELEIPKGTRIDDFVKVSDCPTCECNLVGIRYLKTPVSPIIPSWVLRSIN